MHIYLKNNHAKFHPDPIWNDETLDFFEECRPNKKIKRNNKMSNNTCICEMYTFANTPKLKSKWEVWGSR